MQTLLANQAIVGALAGILTSVAGLIVAVAALIKAKATEAVQKDQKKGGGGSTTIVMPTTTAGATAPALAAPIWNQLDDPLPDGAQDPYRQYDCGEECVAMAVAACGGPTLPAYILRTLLGAVAGTKGTTGQQLVYLLKLLKIPAHVRTCDAQTAFVEWQHSYAARFLIVARGYWVDIGYPHWVLIRRTDEGGITFNDPFGGQERWMSKADAQARYLGDYVHLDTVISGAAVLAPLV